jgi:hypothetical protein
MKLLSGLSAACLTATCFVSTSLRAQEPFGDLVGTVAVKPVDFQAGQGLEMPFITWGGDVATFHANGGLETKPDTICQRQGLKLKLVPGDDFVGQVRNYLGGKTPFLRGTLSMLGQASEVINSNPQTRAVVFLQLTWSKGDHMVARENCLSLNDLKGKKIALQKGGPHVGMLADILRTAQLKWGDVQVIWAPDLAGPKGSAARFRQDPTVDACFVISPDMTALTGGLTQTGSGAAATVKGAHVLVSTAEMRRSIVDVYACRKDFFDAHPDIVKKFTAGYLKACEDMLPMKQSYDLKRPTPEYSSLLKNTQDIFGKEVIPTIDDAHGLVSDCVLVGLPGNIEFFTDPGYLSNLDNKEREVLDLAASLNNAKTKLPFLRPDFDYDELVKLGGLVIRNSEMPTPGPVYKQGTIFSFTINFEPNQDVVHSKEYAAGFDKAVRDASLFATAAIVVRGHADPTKMLYEFVQDGLATDEIKQVGQPGNYKYFMDGAELDLKDTKKILALINNGNFQDAKDTKAAALKLSVDRAKAVRQAVLGYAKAKGFRVQEGQFKIEGVGVAEPIIPHPKSKKEAEVNMRVEFRIVKAASPVSPEFRPNEFKFDF